MNKIKSIIVNGKTVLIATPLLFIMAFTLYNSDATKEAVKYGLLLSGEIIIPSLFPFTCLTLFLSSTKIGNIMDKILDILFLHIGISGKLIAILFMSLIGGYPLGGKMISKLYNDGAIDNNTANTLLIFCVNPGPAFVIVAVGSGMLKSTKAGIIIFISSTLISILMALVIMIVKKPRVQNDKIEYLNFSDGLVKSISDTTSAMLTISGYVIFFQCIGSFVKSSFSYIIVDIIMTILEVTNGCVIASKHNIMITAFCISFGGLAVHFQIFALCNKIKIDSKNFYFGRIIHAVLTSFLTLIIEKIFPVTYTAGSYGNINKVFTFSKTSLCTVALMSLSVIMMCFWFMSIKQKSSKDYSINMKKSMQ